MAQQDKNKGPAYSTFGPAYYGKRSDNTGVRIDTKYLSSIGSDVMMIALRPPIVVDGQQRYDHKSGPEYWLGTSAAKTLMLGLKDLIERRSKEVGAVALVPVKDVLLGFQVVETSKLVSGKEETEKAIAFVIYSDIDQNTKVANSVDTILLDMTTFISEYDHTKGTYNVNNANAAGEMFIKQFEDFSRFVQNKAVGQSTFASIGWQLDREAKNMLTVMTKMGCAPQSNKNYSNSWNGANGSNQTPVNTSNVTSAEDLINKLEN